MAKDEVTENRQYHSSFVSFSLAMILSLFCQFFFGHDIVCLLEKLTKERQYNGQRETDKRQTISWPKGN
jgi:hypothetical protein